MDEESPITLVKTDNFIFVESEYGFLEVPEQSAKSVTREKMPRKEKYVIDIESNGSKLRVGYSNLDDVNRDFEDLKKELLATSN